MEIRKKLQHIKFKRSKKMILKMTGF